MRLELKFHWWTKSGGVRKTITKAEWQATQQVTTPMPTIYHGNVTPAVHQFDVWMEHLGLNSGAHASCAKAVDTVEVSLGSFITSPSKATDPEYTGPSAAHGTGPSSSTPAGVPVSEAYDPSGYAPPGGGAPGAGGDLGAAPLHEGPGLSIGTLPGDDTRFSTGPVPGIDGFIDHTPGLNAGPVRGGLDDFWLPKGTAAAGVEAPAFDAGIGTAPTLTSVPSAGVSGITAGAGLGAPGGAGMGSLGSGLGAGMMTGLAGAPGMAGTTGTAGGLANSSFQMGPAGRGQAAPGVPGQVPAGGAGGGQAPMGTAPLNARKAEKKADAAEGDLDETWLSEDEDVWGSDVGPDGLPR